MIIRKSIKFGLTVLVSILLTNLHAKIIYVSSENTRPVNDGLSWSTAYYDLKQALNAAIQDDEIWVAKGIYKTSQTQNRNDHFLLRNGIKLYGGFNGSEANINDRKWEINQTVLDGNIHDSGIATDNAFNVLRVIDPEGSTRVDGFIIRNGYASKIIGLDINHEFNGGGIYVSSKNTVDLNFTLANCKIENNFSKVYGGGLYILIGNKLNKLVLDQVSFMNSKSEQHHQNFGLYFQSESNGIYDFRGCNFNDGSYDIQGTQIKLNKSQFSGAEIRMIISDSIAIDETDFNNSVFNTESAWFHLVNSKFVNRSRLVYSAFNHAWLINNRFSGNNKIFLHGGGHTDMVNSLIHLNIKGSIAFTGNYRYNIINSSFINNSQSDSAASIYDNAFIITTGKNVKMTIANSLFYNSKEYSPLQFNINREIANIGNILIANNLFSMPDSNYMKYEYKIKVFVPTDTTFRPDGLPLLILGYKKDSTIYNYFNFNGYNKFLTKPIFMDEANNNYTLSPCSPGINEGNDSIIKSMGIVTDLFNNPRIIGKKVDIGAIESKYVLDSAISSIQRVSCSGKSDGSIQLSLANKDILFNLYKNNNIQNDWTHLSAGRYILKYDSKNCTDSLNIDIDQPDSMVIQSNVNSACDSLSGAQIIFSASGGTEPYNLFINEQVSPFNFSKYISGKLDFRVNDKNNCSLNGSIHIDIPAPMKYKKEIKYPSTVTLNDGEIKILGLSGGLAPYIFSWSDHANTMNRQNLDTGLYQLTIRDNRGCQRTEIFNLYIPSKTGFEAVLNPNIVSGNSKDPTIYLSVFNDQKIRIQIFDIAGKSIMDQNNLFKSGSFQIPLNLSLAPGHYLVRISDSDAYFKTWIITSAK